MSDPEALDPGLAAYAEAIEAHFRARRGTEVTLSPRDFALARSYFGAGLPLAAVLLGIDRAFESDPNVSTLHFCRRRIEDLVRAGARPALAATGAGGESLRTPDVEEVLSLLKERLLSLPPRARGAFALALRRIEEIQDLVAVASRPNWDYVRSKLQEIDEDVSSSALFALPDDEAQALRADAKRAGERHRGRVDDASLEDAVGRLAVQRAREKLGLPRVSLI
jgi:hypothetical protein